jgi:hypothetical protein
MKKIFILLLCIGGTFANAQNSMTATTTMQRPDWNNMLSDINVKKIIFIILKHNTTTVFIKSKKMDSS